MTIIKKAAIALFGLFIVWGLFADKNSLIEQNNSSSVSATTEPQATISEDKVKEQEQAVKDLQFLMEKFAKEGLVDSYKLSSDNKIYVTDVWFGLTVQSKKDFFNMATDLKKKATGYGNLEIRHFQSNELFADMTGIK